MEIMTAIQLLKFNEKVAEIERERGASFNEKLPTLEEVRLINKAKREVLGNEE